MIISRGIYHATKEPKVKLKMLKGPRSGQKTMVCLTSTGAIPFVQGESKEVTDEQGHEILVKWKGCFEEVKKKAPAKKTIDADSYENK